MKSIKILFFLFLTLAFASCDYLQSPDETATVSEGFITFPAVSIKGEQYVTIPVGGSYVDPGAEASLGTEDISADIVVTGEVDPSTAGVYILDYSVSVVNALDEESSASQQRYVAVISESVSSTDLSGTYNGNGTAISGAWTQAATVTKISGSWYRIDKALASGNNLGIFFALVGGANEGEREKIVVPTQPSRFGTVNSTSPGTRAELTDTGFEWDIFISCCGVFGPIIFSR